MIKLYIDNKLVDIDETIDIKMTYQATDIDNPTAIKNSFSKSVELKGTPKNNDIFGNIYKLDFSTIENADVHSGIFFDPRKRTPFELYNNGEAIECGYMQLNNIKINDGVISYNINLYGMLGDFMYNLMYNEDGTQKTLADIYYGFQDENGSTYTAEDEKKKYIIKWNKEYIKEGWDKLKTDDYSDMRPSTYIKSAPVYGGFYEDFDSDKFLIDFFSIPESHRQTLFPNGYQGVGEGGYILGTAQREMDEWETRDLRSVYQRPAVKLDFVMKAIVNDSEDYTVEWDEDILNSPYFKDTWIVFDRLDFDENPLDKYNALTPANTLYKGGAQSTFLTYEGVSTLDTSNMENPFMRLKLNLLTLCDTKDLFATSYSQLVKLDMYRNVCKVQDVVGGYLTKINIYDGDTVVKSTNWNFITTGFNGFILNPYEKKYVDKLSNYTNIPKDEISVFAVSYDYDEEKRAYTQLVPLEITSDLPITEHCRVELVVWKVCFDEQGNETDFGQIKLPYIYLSDISKHWWSVTYGKPLQTKGALVSIDEGGYYDGNINPSIQRENVNKQILFGSKATPYDYLTSFSKLFNFRFEADIPNKRIFIKTRQNYYKNEVINIDDLIDRKSMVIKPTTITSKYYTYKLDDGGTYAAYLYKKRNKDGYGEYRLSTPYDFNRDVKDIFSGNVYSQTIPYQQSSIFYNDVENQYPFTLAPTYSYTIYKGLDYESEETTVNGYSATNRLYAKYDSVPKVCLFDSENDSADIAQCILFFDGFKSFNGQLSDNNEYMYSINGNPCYLITGDETAVIKLDEIPQFWNYLSTETGNFSHTTDFYKPNKIFTQDDSKYGANTINICDYWQKYIKDVYDKDVKSVEVNMLFNWKPREAMCRFYYFDNAIWTLNKVSNYSIFQDMQKCEFIKVASVNNYIL